MTNKSPKSNTTTCMLSMTVVAAAAAQWLLLDILSSCSHLSLALPLIFLTSNLLEDACVTCFPWPSVAWQICLSLMDSKLVDMALRMLDVHDGC